MASQTIMRWIWKILGTLCLGMAYIGVVVPGIPFSIFLVGSAYCFARSSPKMHDWLYNHKFFGPFLTNWQEKRIFPTKMKYAMIATMASTLIITYLATGNPMAVLYSGIFMSIVAIWSWRYPGSLEEWEKRNNDK
jgi:hypothetical protein